MHDVVIIGGGLYGSSTAYHLLRREPALDVCIVEPDPGFEHAASARSNGGVRILFSQAESIRMSQYGHAFYAAFPDAMAIDGEPAALDLFRRGYLIIATRPEQVEDMSANLELQRSLGCRVEAYDAESLGAAFPSLRTDDVRMAVHSPDDMWIDPYGATVGLLRKARAMGASLRRARVVGVTIDGAIARSVRLDDGTTLAGEWLVNATGAWAPELCRLVGFDVPVVPIPMMAYYFETRAELDAFGVTIDQDNIGFRPEGAGYISLIQRRDLAGRFRWEADHELFEQRSWPRLAHRVPAFESLRVMSSYCCHYAMNHFDGNLLLGAWPGGPDNFLIATGASGHGLQHAPAAGRALSELILDRAFRTLDLSRFGCARVVENRPDPERGFTA